MNVSILKEIKCLKCVKVKAEAYLEPTRTFLIQACCEYN